MFDKLLNLIRWPNTAIHYKSGKTIRVFFKKLTYTRYLNGDEELTWEACDKSPILLNLDEVESIYSTRS